MSLSLPLRNKIIKAIVLLSFLSGVLLSPKLWMSYDRTFPLIKLIECLYGPSLSADLTLLVLFVVSYIFWIFYDKVRNGLMTISLLLLILLQDEMRWQPWVYLYLLMLLPFIFQANKSNDQKSIQNTLQLIIAGVYVWSGIQKLNTHFIEGTFSQMISSLGFDWDVFKWKKLGYCIPSIEIATGLCLLFTKIRKVAVGAAILTHLIILVYLGQLKESHNSIVYPWNMAMIAFVIILFWNNNGNTFQSLGFFKAKKKGLVPIVMVWILPILNLFGYWDHFLSFSFYSGKPSDFYIAIEESQLKKLSPKMSQYFVTVPGMQGGQLIGLDRWSFKELNVPFYPESKAFKKFSQSFCNLGIDEGKIIFVEMSHEDEEQHFKTFTCK